MKEPYNSLPRLLADIKDTLSRLVKTVDECQQADRTKNQADSQAKHDAVVRLPEEVTEFYRSEQRDRPEKNKHERIRIALEIVAVLAAIGLAIVTLCTLVTFNGQLAEMKHQTCIQQEAATKAERAWVGLAETPQVNTTPLNQKRFSASIRLFIKNFGHGPAFNVRAGSQLATHGHVKQAITSTCNLLFPFIGLKPTVPVLASGSIQGTQWGEIIFPDQPPYVTNIIWNGESSAITGQEVFIVGCVVYKDQFGNPHWTKFSFSTGPLVSEAVRDSSSFRHLYISSANNYTDDAEKKPPCSN